MLNMLSQSTDLHSLHTQHKLAIIIIIIISSSSSSSSNEI